MIALVILGLVMIYAVVHLFFLQNRAWDRRSLYEKVVTVAAGVAVLLMILGSATA